MSTVRGVRDRRFKFTQILNEMFEDKELSLKAKGFIGYCLTKPETWTFHVSQLCQVLKEGQTSMKYIINECIKHGYAFRYQPRKSKGGKLLPMETIVSDSKLEIATIRLDIEASNEFKNCLPIPGKLIAKNKPAKKPVDGNPLAGFPLADRPLADRPLAENHPPSNTTRSEVIRKEKQQQGNHRQHEEQYGQELPSAVVVASPIEKEEIETKRVPEQAKTDNKSFREIATQQKLTKPKIYECLSSLSITDEEKQSITRCNTEENVIEAIRLAKHKQTPPDNLGGFINWAAKNEIKYEEKLTKEQKDEVERTEQNTLQERNKNFIRQSKLTSEYTYNGVKFSMQFSISDKPANNFIRFSIRSRGHKDYENIDIQFSDASFIEKFEKVLARFKITEELIDQHHKLIKQNEKFITCFDFSTVYNGFKFKKLHDEIYFFNTRDDSCTAILNLGDKDLEDKLKHTLHELKINPLLPTKEIGLKSMNLSGIDPTWVEFVKNEEKTQKSKPIITQEQYLEHMRNKPSTPIGEEIKRRMAELDRKRQEEFFSELTKEQIGNIPQPDQKEVLPLGHKPSLFADEHSFLGNDTKHTHEHGQISFSI